MDELLTGPDIQTLKDAETWTDEQYRKARSQVFAKMRLDYLNALYARGLRGNRLNEAQILSVINDFQDFIRTGRLAE